MAAACVILLLVFAAHMAQAQTCLPSHEVVSFCEEVLAAVGENHSVVQANTTLVATQEEWLSGFPHGRPALLQAHVYCMFLAAPLWFATAAVTAFGRYKSWWLQIHIALALSTVAITAGGILCIVLHIENEGSGHFRTGHHIVGISLGVLLVAHVLGGALRPRDPAAGSRDVWGKAQGSELTSARRLWQAVHTVTGFPVLGSLFMYQVLYSGHVVLRGSWAFPLNFLLFVPVVVLKKRLDSGANRLRENLEESAVDDVDAANPLSDSQPEELLPCPDITADIEWLYANRETGGFSAPILIALASCGQFVPHNLLGTFWLRTFERLTIRHSVFVAHSTCT
jgi:hypothetical protein